MSRSARATGRAFSPVAMIIAILVGAVCFAGLGLLSAYAPELKSGNNGGEHALSRAATGYGALPNLLRNLDVPVVMNRGVLTEEAIDSLLVLTPSPDTRPEDIEDVRHDGAVLIVLPKWQAIPDAKHPGWVQTVGTLPPAATLATLPDTLRKNSELLTRNGSATVVLRRPDGTPFGAPVKVEGLRTLSGPQWIPVVVDDQDHPVLVMHSELRTYVLADPDLINTQGLKTLAGAKTGVALIDIARAQTSPVIFDLTLHGLQRSRNLLRLMLEPPLLGMTLVLAALAVFVGFQAIIRFGPAREMDRIIALGKRGLADNTAGLVRLARREHHMAAPYALLIRAAAARAIGAPRHLSDASLDAFLDRVGRTNGAADTYSSMAEQARNARTAGDLMQVARALYRWNQELTRGRQ